MNRSKHVNKVDRDTCPDWNIDLNTIYHSSRRYFSIVCIKYNGIERIMIDQPEIGLLGFIVTSNDKNRQWLIQNKPEPGNVNYYQYAPTVQATKSNYERVHGGKSIPFLEYFQNEAKLIVNIEGSEQGDRFLNKYNQNCKYLISPSFNLKIDKSFLWITTEHLKQKLGANYTVNTDARSVISSGTWNLLTEDVDNIFLDSHLEEKNRSIS